MILEGRPASDSGEFSTMISRVREDEEMRRQSWSQHYVAIWIEENENNKGVSELRETDNSSNLLPYNTNKKANNILVKHP